MSEKITFSELVELIAEQSKQSQASTNSFIGELVNIIESGLRKSGSVSISGFGKFELRWMNERPGVNPQTGEEITIPGQNKVVFKPYKALREDVNRPYSKMEAQVLDESPKDSSDKKSDDDLEEPSTKSSAGEEDQDDGNDFLIERPNPAKDKSELKSTDDLGEEKKKDEAEEDNSIQEKFTPVFVNNGNKEDSKGSNDPNAVQPKLPADKNMPALNAGKKSKLAKRTQDSGKFNWTYAAAAVIVALAIFIIFLLSQQYIGDDTPQLASEQEQITAPVTPTPEQDETVEETEPPPAEPDTAPQTDTDTEVHTVDAGESLWSISETDLGNPYLWPMIYGLNLDQIDNPNIIPVSADLTVPVISDPDNLSESQLKQVAEGYLAVYEWTKSNNPDEAKYFLWAVGVFSPEMLDLAASSVDQADLTFAKTR
ncbi:HU family DNA-binding protein [Rhodohalobacter sp.]|uniref:HU family DNA-binding protein n=1 Tax=Rhodohalobacter sp. TaxID=1974210 RepID=UPI002ACD71FD|nr:HU family DNA-binding protein [Rhodohalobacter sp.]MDZ7755275.1 HU family DNA-binding protein [Rhodohalobacter sp.]